jgi:elongator complex protein 3
VAGARRRSYQFDPTPHERELTALIDALVALPELDARGIDRVVKRHPREGRGFFSKSQIIKGFRHLGGEARWGLAEPAFLARLRMRPVRTLSGVTPVTVLTKPYPCPGRCIFCPSDLRMPKSYIANEPGAQRAEDNGFDPYLQTWNRLAAYREIGHPVEKVELIVLGGTWSFHPETYQRWFVKRCFEALSDFGAGVDGRGQAGQAPARFGELGALERVAGAEGPEEDGGSYNRVVGEFLAENHGEGLLHASEAASWAELEEAQLENETAGARCVGLSVETRPDHVDEAEALRLRRLGVTKLQVGIQSVSDRVLALNRRGHDVATTRRALALLRRMGFKLQAHWMPNLHGSTPAQDVADFARLFDDAGLRPDELKIYPCALISSAELMELYERGEWQPYPEQELLEVLMACLEATPAYCRVTRVIRDFSAGDIAAGSKKTNLREVAERRLREQGRSCQDIRSREIRADPFEIETLDLSELAYETSVGEERFLQFTTPEGRLVAFLRLLLPNTPAPLTELEGSALIREVHVYGATLALGHRGGPEPQHLGLGRRLIAQAAARARGAGFPNLAVISAVGTREYYRTLGFQDAPLYQHLTEGGDVPSGLPL